MATAVKNTPETSATTLFDRPAAVSLVGVLYVVACFGIVFKLVPYVFWDLLHIPEGTATHLLLAVLIFASAIGLIIGGVVLLGNRAPHGARAGVFVGVVGFILILLLTRWASIWIEYGSYNFNYYNPTAGAALTAAVGLALLLIGGFFFLHPAVERYLIQFEDQGWFSVSQFKPLQGVRVRRGTIIGIVILVGAGLFTLYNRDTLARLPPNWELNIPFTGKTTVNVEFLGDMNADTKGPLDVNTFLATQLRAKGLNGPTFTTDRYTLRDFNRELSSYVKVETAGEADNLMENRVYPKSEVEQIAADLDKQNRLKPTWSALPTLVGTESYATVQLLPLVQFTVLFILAALAGWMAWRIVNYPAFADFLIATEAEMNKVSWTSRKNLIKDTIVVLVTVFLMAVYLFAMDQAWSHVLSWKFVRILQIQPENNESNKSVENKPW